MVILMPKEFLLKGEGEMEQRQQMTHLCNCSRSTYFLLVGVRENPPGWHSTFLGSSTILESTF